MALALYDVLQKFLSYTLYHWATRGIERSTISTASSFNHKYWMIQDSASYWLKALDSAMIQEVSSTCCKARIFLLASLCTLLLKRSSPKLWLHQHLTSSLTPIRHFEGVNCLTRMVNYRHYIE